MGRPVVNGLEVDALAADTEPEQQIVQVAQLAVRYADAPPDAGAAQTLPVAQDAHNVFDGNLGAAGHGRGQLFQNAQLILGLQVGNDGFGRKGIKDFHVRDNRAEVILRWRGGVV